MLCSKVGHTLPYKPIRMFRRLPKHELSQGLYFQASEACSHSWYRGSSLATLARMDSVILNRTRSSRALENLKNHHSKKLRRRALRLLHWRQWAPPPRHLPVRDLQVYVGLGSGTQTESTEHFKLQLIAASAARATQPVGARGYYPGLSVVLSWL